MVPFLLWPKSRHMPDADGSYIIHTFKKERRPYICLHNICHRRIWILTGALCITVVKYCKTHLDLSLTALSKK